MCAFLLFFCSHLCGGSPLPHVRRQATGLQEAALDGADEFAVPRGCRAVGRHGNVREIAFRNTCRHCCHNPLTKHEVWRSFGCYSDCVVIKVRGPCYRKWQDAMLTSGQHRRAFRFAKCCLGGRTWSRILHSFLHLHSISSWF